MSESAQTGLVAVVEKDPRLAQMLQQHLDPLAQPLKLHVQVFPSLEAFHEARNPPTADQTPSPIPNLALTILDLDCLTSISVASLTQFQKTYGGRLVVTGFHDEAHPFKGIETWPVANVLFKPFDMILLREHLKFAIQPGVLLRAEAVHSITETLQVEKIRRHHLMALSDFGFRFKSTSSFIMGHPYRFYHFIFKDQNKLSLWAKPVHVENGIYDFILATPRANSIANVRHRLRAAQEKVQNVVFRGRTIGEKHKTLCVGLELIDANEIEKLTDFFNRHFPQITSVKIDENFKEPAGALQLLISEVHYNAADFAKRFGGEADYIHISNETFSSSSIAEETLKHMTIRLGHPIDRMLLSKLIEALFPNIRDKEPAQTQWIAPPEEALFSETITARNFSEVAFECDRDKTLPPGSYQEFALPQDDEQEIKPIKAHIQWCDEKPNQQKLYPSQVVFYGLRDDILKKIRIWMLQNHIRKKNSS
jgi:hypothetical protein